MRRWHNPVEWEKAACDALCDDAPGDAVVEGLDRISSALRVASVRTPSVSESDALWSAHLRLRTFRSGLMAGLNRKW